jgi:hypothetical protein
MSRLTKQGTIRKIARGVYDYPKINDLIGAISPDMDDLARIIAAKTNDQIFCSGAMAANLIGISTQMPMKLTYATSGPSRVKKIGDLDIIFKHTRIPILDYLPYIANLTLQSMAYLGKKAIDDDIIAHYAKKLSQDDMVNLSKAASHLPAWMTDAILKIQHRINGQIS